MSTQVRQEGEKYTIEVDDEIGTIIFTWEDFSQGEEFRQYCEELLEFIEEHDYSKLIIDQQGIRAHREEDKAWLQEDWIPREIEAGIEYSVSVHADSAISRMETEKFVDQTSDLPFTYVLASDMDEAKEWIAEQ